MKFSSIETRRIGLGVALFAAGALSSGVTSAVEEKSLAEQIFDTMVQVHGVAPHYRLVHAKGVVQRDVYAIERRGELPKPPIFRERRCP